MHSAQGMMKSGMQSTRIYIIGKSKLFYAPEPLKQRFFNNIENQFAVDSNESIYRIVEYFPFVQAVSKELK
jgi:hypothetical protein